MININILSNLVILLWVIFSLLVGYHQIHDFRHKHFSTLPKEYKLP